LFDEKGERLRPSHTNKKGVRFRYYVSPRVMTGERDQQGWRLPAAQIEQTVTAAARALLKDRAFLTSALQEAIEANRLESVFAAAEHLAQRLNDSEYVSSHLGTIIKRVDLSGDGLRMQLAFEADGQPITVEGRAPMLMKRRGVEMKIIIPGAETLPNQVDPALLKALARAHKWMDGLRSGEIRTAADIARMEGITPRYVGQLLPLAFLAPSIITAIVNGTQPATMSLQSLVVRQNLPADWAEQEADVGLA
jgi:hypothetical protein